MGTSLWTLGRRINRLAFVLRLPYSCPMKPSLTIRVEVCDLAEWEKKAKLRGLSISEWIRRRCNEDGPSQPEGKRDEKRHSQNVRRSKDVSVGERSVSVSGGAPRMDEPEYKSHPKNCSCFLCNAARTAGLK